VELDRWLGGQLLSLSHQRPRVRRLAQCRLGVRLEVRRLEVRRLWELP
jgi:hypothetical protein